MEGIVSGYNDTFRGVIENSNWNLASVEEFGMSEAVYEAMIADLNNPEVADIKPYLNQLYGQWILDWVEVKSEAERTLGNESVADLIAAGFDTTQLLDTIQNNLSGELPEDVSIQEIIDRLLEYNPAEHGTDPAVYIRTVFDDVGVVTQESITDLEAILKAGNEAINEQIREIGKQKLTNSGYKKMFEGLLEGMSMQDVSLD